ncbi:MAG TPA: hypothetical protein VHG91_16200 [Longimicrobium sp.]|nr:hypothetical protein [Longimicrobium sp.]
MKSIRRSAGLAALALFAALPASAQELPPAKQIVDRYVEAIGGRAALAKLNTRHSVVEMSMPAMGMSMTVEMFQARPNKMFSRMEMQGMSFTSGYDGQVAWSNNPMQGPRLLEGAEMAQTLQQADFDASMDYAKSFPTMETVGRREVAGRPCWNVRMVHTSGIEMHNCYDVDSGLLIGASAKQVSAMGEVEANLVFSDYQVFDGVRMATKTTTSMMGQEMTATLKSVTHGPVDPAVFELPAEIKALVAQRPRQ